ncbi:hypothetical protein BGZ94_006660, partial [Podila epigama]
MDIPPPASTSYLPSSSDASHYDGTSGYVYIVLLITMLVAFAFLVRMVFARRKARLIAMKDPDYE